MEPTVFYMIMGSGWIMILFQSGKNVHLMNIIASMEVQSWSKT